MRTASSHPIPGGFAPDVGLFPPQVQLFFPLRSFPRALTRMQVMHCKQFFGKFLVAVCCLTPHGVSGLKLTVSGARAVDRDVSPRMG